MRGEPQGDKVFSVGLEHPEEWRGTVGALPDDATTRRAFKLGAQWRKTAKIA